MEVVKIRTRKGKIITLTVSKKNDLNYYGVDKFGDTEIIPIKDIESLSVIKSE